MMAVNVFTGKLRTEMRAAKKKQETAGDAAGAPAPAGARPSQQRDQQVLRRGRSSELLWLCGRTTSLTREVCHPSRMSGALRHRGPPTCAASTHACCALHGCGDTPHERRYQASRSTMPSKPSLRFDRSQPIPRPDVHAHAYACGAYLMAYCNISVRMSRVTVSVSPNGPRLQRM